MAMRKELWNQVKGRVFSKKSWLSDEVWSQLAPVIKQAAERDVENLQELGEPPPIEPKEIPIPAPGTVVEPSSKYRRVEHLKKYDVIYMTTMALPHYLLVHRVVNDVVYGVIITSKDKVHSLYKIEKDRFFQGSYISSTYLSYTLEEALGRFSRVYEDKREANRIFRTLSEYYRKQFNLRKL